MFMNNNNGLHQEDVFFGDDDQQAVGEYLVVVEEAEEEDQTYSLGYSSSTSVEQWNDHQFLEDSAAAVSIPSATQSQLDLEFIAKNTTQILVEHVTDQHDSHGFKRKYSMKNRPKASYYKCKMCHVVVKHPSKILEHIRVHTGERPFPCPHCSLTFTQTGALTAHLRIHNGDRPYACVFCAKRFTTSGQRSVHQKSCQLAEGNAIQSQPGKISSRRVSIRRQQKVGEDYKIKSQRTVLIQKTVGTQLHSENDVVDNLALPELSFEENFEEPPAIPLEAHISCSENTDNEDISNSYSVSQGEKRARRSISNRLPPTRRLETRKRNRNSRIISMESEIQESTQLLKAEEVLGPERKAGDYVLPQLEYFIEEAVEEFDECEEQQDTEIQARSQTVSSQPIRRSIRRSIPVYPAKSQPPSKGRKRQDQEEVEKVFVDSALYEFAAPQTHDNGIAASTSKAGRRLRAPVADTRRGGLEEEERVEQKPARNLDWIIDAIAEGKSVDKASPHSRRQATFHTCEHCGLELKYPSKIAAHMRTHTKEKPFKCEICGAGFAQNTTLRMHLRRHLDQKPYHCPDAQCGQRFINGGLLNAHIQKRHMQPRRFACLNGCGKIFNSNAERQKHEQGGCHNLKFQYAYEDISEENERDTLDLEEQQQEEEHYQSGQLQSDSCETYYY